MNSLCRICLFKVEPSECLNIFTESRNNELLSDILTNFASVHINENDYFPKIICIECSKKLLVSSDFKKLIIASDIELRKHEEFNKGSLETDISEKVIKEDVDVNNEETYKLPNKVCKVECIPIFSENDELQNEFEKVKIEENKLFKKKTIRKRKKKKTVNTRPERSENCSTENRPKSVRCPTCNATFKSSYHLNIHKRIHTGIFPHSCDLCNKQFPTSTHVKVHRRTHFEERPFACSYCGKTFKALGTLISHKKIHLEIRPRYICSVCGKALFSNQSLRGHEQSHITEKPFVCEFCSKRFNQSNYLLKHLKVHKEKTPCPKCGKSFSNLKLHLETHLEDRTKDHVCEECNKTFSTRSTLNVHMRIHRGIRPFKCTVCNKNFTQSSCLVRHMRTHTGETPYPCSYCDRKFSYTHHRLKHIQKEHPDESDQQ